MASCRIKYRKVITNNFVDRATTIINLVRHFGTDQLYRKMLMATTQGVYSVHQKSVSIENAGLQIQQW